LRLLLVLGLTVAAITPPVLGCLLENGLTILLMGNIKSIAIAVGSSPTVFTIQGRPLLLLSRLFVVLRLGS